MNYKTAILIRLFFLVLIVTTYTNHCNSQIVLSEIMFDPAGSEYYDEFIEIYNSSSSDTVDLEGWIISDGSGTDQIIGVDMGTRLPPNGYGIILDEGYFDNSTYYDSLIPGSALVLTIDNGTFGSSGLSNSTPETVFLISSFGDTVAAYQYSLNNDPGFSDEKIDLLGGDLSENWTNSLTLNGTPGAQNSVKRLDYDLALEGIKYSPCYPFPDDEITCITRHQDKLIIGTERTGVVTATGLINEAAGSMSEDITAVKATQIMFSKTPTTETHTNIGTTDTLHKLEGKNKIMLVIDAADVIYDKSRINRYVQSFKIILKQRK